MSNQSCMPTSSTMNRLIENRNKVDARNDCTVWEALFSDMYAGIFPLSYVQTSNTLFPHLQCTKHRVYLVQYYSKVFGIKW